jgi:predicted NUDIX family phosphoesterase
MGAATRGFTARRASGSAGTSTRSTAATIALMAGLRREWDEELEADWEPDFRLVGLLNDDSNPVGAVHLGIVFTVEADGRPVAVREREKLVGEFVEPAAVVDAWERLETWSQLAAAAMGIRAPG